MKFLGQLQTELNVNRLLKTNRLALAIFGQQNPLLLESTFFLHPIAVHTSIVPLH
jgi:hypothetical protein